jgi:hypothetical protein
LKAVTGVVKVTANEPEADAGGLFLPFLGILE